MAGEASYYVTTAAIGPADAVWRILTDGPGYADWNPEIIGVEGEFAPGRRRLNRTRAWCGPAACRSASSSARAR